MIIPESEYKNYILNLAAPHFHIQKEVTGYFFSNRCRIDAVIKPKDNTDWANKSIAFGVEFKHFSDGAYDGDSKSINYYSKQFKQIIDYSYTQFNGYGRLPILICPPLFNNRSGNIHKISSALQLIKNCMGQCNVGELTVEQNQGLAIYFNSHHRIWSERWGVGVGKIQTFRIKTGSGAAL